MVFRLFCLRHGRTAWNAVGKFQGQSDIPLDEVGRGQARETAAYLHDLPIDYAVSSDLSRAQETARIVLGERNLKLHLDADLRERNFGAWEGLTWDEIVAAFPEHRDNTIMNARVFEPLNGERFSATTERVLRAYRRICTQMQDGQTALLVAHAGALHALLDGLFGAERDNFMITPASVIELEVNDGEARIRTKDAFRPAST